MNPDSASTPVLLIIFNRPSKVIELIKALSHTKPKHIYVAADGPRAHVQTDEARSKEARMLATTIPWECEIHTLFQDTNLGCKVGVSTAITWFFTQVTAGIILEDDCVPAPTFLSYATHMLERYENDDQVMHINGTTFLSDDDPVSGTDSYYFSKIPLVWGWATWRRAWQLYDIEMKELATLRKILTKDTAFSHSSHSYYWAELCTHIGRDNIDTWDAQWVYTILHAHGCCITPRKNLITNIGFDSEATHTTTIVDFAPTHSSSLDTISHPPRVAINYRADSKTMHVAFINTLTKRLKYYIKNLV